MKIDVTNLNNRVEVGDIRRSSDNNEYLIVGKRGNRFSIYARVYRYGSGDAERWKRWSDNFDLDDTRRLGQLVAVGYDEFIADGSSPTGRWHVLFKVGRGVSYRAGCHHNFTPRQAIEHWSEPGRTYNRSKLRIAKKLIAEATKRGWLRPSKKRAGKRKVRR